MTHTDGPELLAAWMQKNGMGQREMFRATGIHQPALSRFLNGKGVKRLSVTSSRLLAGMTGIPVEKFMPPIRRARTERSVKTSGQKVA